ncbi:MAG: polysaccharide biosynthesis C-terminal domain-containing protein [Bacteroidales bacterium]
MLGQIKKIFRSSAIYGIGQIAPKLVGLILVPVLTNPAYLSPDDYGKLSLLEASSMLLIALFGFGFNYALERWYWDKAYINKRKEIFFTLIVATIVLTSLLWGFLSMFSGSISVLLTDRENWQRMLNLLFLASALESLVFLPTTILRLEEKPGLFVTSNIFRFVIYLLFTLYFLIIKKTGLEGIYEARVLSQLAIILVLIIPVFKRITPKLELSALKEMAVFRLPLVLSTVSYIIFNITDRFSLRILSNSTFTDVGKYSLSYSIVNSVKVLVLSSVWLSLRPMIYQMMDTDGNKRFYSKVMKYMSFGVVLMLLIVTVFGQEIIRVLAKSSIFYNSFYILPILAVALIFDTLKDITQSIGLTINKKTGIIAVTMVISTIINIGLNILLIPRLDIYGAGLSTTISQLFFFLVTYFYSQKHYPIPYEIGRIATMVIVFMILGAGSLLLRDMDLLIRIPLKIIIVAAFPVILFVLKFYEDIEITRIRQLITRIWHPSEWMKLIKG